MWWSYLKDMYYSKLGISHHGKEILLQRLHVFLEKQKTVYCRALKRKVFLGKLPEVLRNRHDVKRRLQSFFVAMDILQNCSQYTISHKDGYKCFEMVGKDSNNKKVFIHVREEEHHKDKMLYFISCYSLILKKAPPPSLGSQSLVNRLVQ